MDIMQYAPHFTPMYLSPFVAIYNNVSTFYFSYMDAWCRFY